MELKFYTLMYVANDEYRQFSGKVYSGASKLDMYVKGACLLDKSLKINEGKSLTLLTNDVDAIRNSLSRIKYLELDVVSIPFDLNVVSGCAFYSAHYKIDVFRYLSLRPDTDYSILLDSDVVSVFPLGPDFYDIIKNKIPMVYNLPRYGGKRRMMDVVKVDENIKWCSWAGGEFIGGSNSFFKALYEDISSFKDSYWKNINNGLFHVGDEMLTSIALSHIWNDFHPIDAGVLGFIYRYWSVYEAQNYKNIGASLIHFPGDKDFFFKTKLSGKTIEELMANYRLYRVKTLFKGLVKKILDKEWYAKL